MHHTVSIQTTNQYKALRGNFIKLLMEQSGSNSDEEEEGAEVGELIESDSELKPKIWRAAVVQEYKDNLIIRVCLEIVEGGETLKTHEILFR